MSRSSKEGTMKSSWLVFGLLMGLMLMPSLVFAQSNPQQLDLDGIANAIGKHGDVTGEMYKVSFPRSDLNVKVGNVAIKPALALVNWAAFLRSGNAAVTYGDLVLLDAELNPVISKLEERGIEIAAVHNHLLHENPRVMFIHFVGRGSEVELAKAIREALMLTATPLAASATAPETKPELAKEIERIIGYEGSMGGGVFHVIAPHNDVHVTAMGAAIPGSMGMNTPLNFQLDGKNAAVNGDFMLLATEVNPVIKVLRANGIEVASVHNHMLDDEPRLFFMHFWAYGDAIDLAKGLKAALNEIHLAH
jgi:biotin operon repressor